jgi:hypothetical protein
MSAHFLKQNIFLTIKEHNIFTVHLFSFPLNRTEFEKD